MVVANITIFQETLTPFQKTLIRHEFPVLKYCNVMEIGCAEKTCSEFENVSRGFSNRFYQTGQVGGIIKTGMSFKGHNVFPRILFATVSSFRAIQAYRGTFRL